MMVTAKEKAEKVDTFLSPNSVAPTAHPGFCMNHVNPVSNLDQPLRSNRSMYVL